MDNLEIWNELKETDPKYTKPFKKAGGFSGTSINPTWQLQRMTEVFGAIGFGWYYEVLETRTHESLEGHISVYRDVAIYINKDGEWSKPIHGTGGDFVVGKNKYGLVADDEAYKKAETDAIGNAMKKLGMSADVFTGMHDDNKYVNDMKAKFGDGEKPNKPSPEKEAPEKQEMTGDQFLDLKKSLDDAKTHADFNKARDAVKKALNEFKHSKEQKTELVKARDKKFEELTPKETQAKVNDLVNSPIEGAACH